MLLSATDVGITILLVLPGFLAYRFAVARRADPTRRSPLWQLAEILEYSLYVHLLGVVILFSSLIIIKALGGDIRISVH